MAPPWVGCSAGPRQIAEPPESKKLCPKFINIPIDNVLLGVDYTFAVEISWPGLWLVSGVCGVVFITGARKPPPVRPVTSAGGFGKAAVVPPAPLFAASEAIRWVDQALPVSVPAS